MSLEAHQDIVEALKERAQQESKPFCYSCYIAVGEEGDDAKHCPKCGSDDNMRLVEGIGCEYGLDWIVERIIKDEFEKLSESELEDLCEERLNDCYDQISIVGVKFFPGDVLREMDPTAFAEQLNEQCDSDVEDGRLVCLDGDYYVVPFDLQP